MTRRRRRARRSGPSPVRLGVLGGFALAGFALLGARAFQLQTLDAERLRVLAESQARTTVKVDVSRAALLDRHGRPLAVSAPVESVAASPRRIADRHHAAVLLAHALDQPVDRVHARLAGDRGFTWVERWVEPEHAARVRALDLPGVRLHRERRRYYPQGNLAAAYLGFAGRDGTGLTGLELHLDADLTGRAAEIPALRDARGHRVPLSDGRDHVRPGRDVALALDARLQAFAQDALQRAVERSGAQRGTLVGMDPRTGELLAVAQVPSFDPNRFWQEPRERFRARAFVDAFEPGSTLKPFVIASALEAGVVSPSTRFDCESGRWRVLNRVIRDYRPHDVLSVRDILRVSSNIGAAKIADRLGSRRLADGLRSFGFGRSPGTGFPGEAAGRVRSIRETQAVERANLAFGQGLTVTAVQLAAAGAVLASGGHLVQPRLERVEPGNVRPGPRVLSGRTSRAVLEMMRRVVADGTGRAAALPHHDVAGKTGTAQKVVDGSYSQSHYVASFLGIVPVVNPRLVLVVVLDEPQGLHTGGVVAAPVFREVAGFAVEQLALSSEGAE